jgi:Peptidase S46
MLKKLVGISALLLTISLIQTSSCFSDEGMWTFDNLPIAQLQEKYNFTPSQQWIRKVQLGSVRFNNGGSGSFVSPNGLVITNHHVAFGQLQKMSTAEHDYVRNGFYAKTNSDEIPCPDLELNVLISTQDVTARVQNAVDKKASDKKQNEQRKAEIAKIEKESTDATGLRSDVIELYHGGQYHLYRYKKYTDIRLVMAPELQAAFFGGDYDNFTYPRYTVDMAFFRVYENDKPIKSPAYFKWNVNGAKEGELVFMPGNPGKTERLLTMSQLEFRRDYALPILLKKLNAARKAYYDFSALGDENARRAKEEIFGVENSLKYRTGLLEGLQSEEFLSKKRDAEASFRAKVKENKELSKLCGKSWKNIAKAQKELTKRFKQYLYVINSRGEAKLANIAKQIVLYVEEMQKPNTKRYAEYRDSALESLRFRLFSKAPIYSDMDKYMFADELKLTLEELGQNDKYVKAALNGQSPEEVADYLVENTKLFDSDFRKQLVDGGIKAVERCNDPMIVWARKIVPIYRELRNWYENEIESVETAEAEKIAKARFAVYGTSIYPDATFTLRLSYGKVASYKLNTTMIPYKTTFYGLFNRAESMDNKPPFQLADMIAAAKDKIDMKTPLDFVSTNDIIGGNSGSPVLNKDAEFVGIVFDGNIQMLVFNYAFSDKIARAISVHPAAMLEALEKVYQTKELVEELTGNQ